MLMSLLCRHGLVRDGVRFAFGVSPRRRAGGLGSIASGAVRCVLVPAERAGRQLLSDKRSSSWGVGCGYGAQGVDAGMSAWPRARRSPQSRARKKKRTRKGNRRSAQARERNKGTKQADESPRRTAHTLAQDSRATARVHNVIMITPRRTPPRRPRRLRSPRCATHNGVASSPQPRLTLPNDSPGHR